MGRPTLSSPTHEALGMLSEVMLRAPNRNGMPFVRASCVPTARWGNCSVAFRSTSCVATRTTMDATMPPLLENCPNSRLRTTAAPSHASGRMRNRRWHSDGAMGLNPVPGTRALKRLSMQRGTIASAHRLPGPSSSARSPLFAPTGTTSATRPSSPAGNATHPWASSS